MVRKRNRLIYGVGFVDIDYEVTRSENVGGKHKIVWICPYYSKWSGMLERCYSGKWLNKHQSYLGCAVHPSWLYLSNFIKWVDSQPNRDWQMCNLDKDLLIEGNKLYSPNTCVFIDQRINKFLTDSAKNRGDCLIGVTYHRRDNIYEVKCCNPFADNKEDGRYLGRYIDELEAHLAWKAKKHEYACRLADLQTDMRVAEALRNRYSPNKQE